MLGARYPYVTLYGRSKAGRRKRNASFGSSTGAGFDGSAAYEGKAAKDKLAAKNIEAKIFVG
jgi:hypothetical protein